MPDQEKNPNEDLLAEQKARGDFGEGAEDEEPEVEAAAETDDDDGEEIDDLLAELDG